MSITYKETENKKKILERLVEFIDQHGGIVKKEQLAELGIDYRRILDYVDSGAIVRIKNGYYTNDIHRFTEEELIAKLFPDGVLCMESALYAYGYIQQKPFGWRIAIDKNTSKSRFKMDYPKIIPLYTEPEVLELGTASITIDGNTFRIYDKERMICDCMKYEGKMEHKQFQEALQSYIKEPEKDIMALMEYARARKVVKKVQSLIGVWL